MSLLYPYGYSKVLPLVPKMNRPSGARFGGFSYAQREVMEYANLQNGFSTKGVKQANREPDGISSKGAIAERATDGLRASCVRIAGAVAALDGVVKLANRVLNEWPKYETLNNQI